MRRYGYGRVDNIRAATPETYVGSELMTLNNLTLRHGLPECLIDPSQCIKKYVKLNQR
jgi:hypothetical protein